MWDHFQVLLYSQPPWLILNEYFCNLCLEVKKKRRKVNCASQQTIFISGCPNFSEFYCACSCLGVWILGFVIDSCSVHLTVGHEVSKLRSDLALLMSTNLFKLKGHRFSVPVLCLQWWFELFNGFFSHLLTVSSPDCLLRHLRCEIFAF